MIEQLQQALKRAAEIRELSWSAEEKQYKVSLQDACDSACAEVGFDTRANFVVFMLLTNCWNESLEWAEMS